MRNKVVHLGSWRLFALFFGLSGCTALSDCKYETGQKIRTSQAWHEFDGCNQQCFTSDYRDGWRKGYYDILTGGDGRPPVVPPKKYWKPPVARTSGTLDIRMEPHVRSLNQTSTMCQHSWLPLYIRHIMVTKRWK